MRRFLTRHSSVKRIANAVARFSFRLVNWLPPRRVIVFYVWPDFARKAEAYADLLRRRGFQPVLRSGRSWFRYFQVHASRDLWIGFWNEYRTDYMPDDYIFINGEQLHLPHWRDDANWTRGLRDAREVWDFARANEQYVKPLGVPWRFVPFGVCAVLRGDLPRAYRGQGTDRRHRRPLLRHADRPPQDGNRPVARARRRSACRHARQPAAWRAAR